MAKVGRYEDGVRYECPGCGFWHYIPIRPSASNPQVLWEYNGDDEQPTLKPSVRVRWSTQQVCHHFVRDGRIEFLSDCTNKLAGQTVDMEEVG